VSRTRRWLVLMLVTALTVPGGLLAPLAASAAGAKASASSTGTISATASGAATPTVGSGATGLSGFPAPPVATSSSTPTVVNTSTGSAAGSSSFSSTNAVIIVIGAVAILLGISYFIWRDARRRAPVREGAGVIGEGRSKPGSKRPPKPRKLSPAERKRRKRGKTRR
jgi:hypothetical protein